MKTENLFIFFFLWKKFLSHVCQIDVTHFGFWLLIRLVTAGLESMCGGFLLFLYDFCGCANWHHQPSHSTAHIIHVCVSIYLYNTFSWVNHVWNVFLWLTEHGILSFYLFSVYTLIMYVYVYPKKKISGDVIRN